jgi:glyoxylase-like metal-dependent hydrolase (beta-lactamase superfamily II)
MKIWKTDSGYKITQVLSGRSNVFLLTNGITNILIDTSLGFFRRILRKRLKQIGVRHIDYLVLTHAHFDHVNNAKYIKEQFGAKIIINEAEAENLAYGKSVMIRGANGFISLLIKAFNTSVLAKIACHPCPYDLKIGDKFELKDMGFNAFIVSTPGHSQGSVSIIVDNEIAIVGDTMVGVLPWTVYPPFLQDETQLIESWRKLLDTGCGLFLPSHGSGNSGELLRKNYLRRIQ